MTALGRLLPTDAADVHISAVADVQLELEHEPSASSEPVGESDAEPKPRPLIVTLLPPLCGKFRLPSKLTTGASKLSSTAAQQLTNM